MKRPTVLDGRIRALPRAALLLAACLIATGATATITPTILPVFDGAAVPVRTTISNHRSVP